MSTLGVQHDGCGGYHEYIEGCSIHQGDIMNTAAVFSTPHQGGYHEYTGGYQDACEGYHEYIGGVQYTGGIVYD